MIFEEALQELRAGKKIRRKVWSTDFLKEDKDKNIKLYSEQWTNGYPSTSQSLLLETISATDWEIVEEHTIEAEKTKTKGLTFVEAIQKVKEGLWVRRAGWASFNFICDDDIYPKDCAKLYEVRHINPNIETTAQPRYICRYELCLDDALAVDWEVMPKPKPEPVVNEKHTPPPTEVKKRSGLTLDEALQLVKKGYKIRRAYWTRIPYHIKMNPETQSLGNWGLDHRCVYGNLGEATFSANDVMATDWKIDNWVGVEGLTFEEALMHAKQDKLIRRKTWGRERASINCLYVQKPLSRLETGDILANDWIVVEP